MWTDTMLNAAHRAFAVAHAASEARAAQGRGGAAFIYRVSEEIADRWLVKAMGHILDDAVTPRKQSVVA